MSGPRTVTQLLLAWSDGDEGARDELMPLVYAELRSIAMRQFARERPGHVWQPTALVHEAYERLVDQRAVQWQDRAHFFAMAALTMRRLLVDYARQQQAAKRGAGQTLLALDEALAVPARQDVDVVALDDALTRLAALAERPARVVELRFFVGLTNEEIAEVLGQSVATVKRDWQMAKAWLREEIKGK